jgi:hypothetical protein
MRNGLESNDLEKLNSIIQDPKTNQRVKMQAIAKRLALRQQNRKK